MRRARLWRKVGDKIVCHLCWRFCKIREGEEGFCKVRIGRNGELYTLSYGNLSAMESRPIEIKPFYHFKPGTTSMTFSSYSCNLECPWCQNWRISKTVKSGMWMEPERIVEEALRAGDASVCASLNEPTLLFEYLLDVFSAAKKRGLYSTMVSNGYMSLRALEHLRDAGLDAINVDIKGDEEVYRRFCGGEARYVWKTVERALKRDIHLEMVFLAVTDVSDDMEVVEYIIENHLKFASERVPLHINRYFPAFMFDKPPTDVEFLKKAAETAKREGIEFVYIGNVYGGENLSKYLNTYCPKCNELLIRRYGTVEVLLKGGKCPRCGYEIYGVF